MRHLSRATLAILLICSLSVPVSAPAADPAGPAWGTGALVVIVERESSSVLVIDSSRHALLGRVEISNYVYCHPGHTGAIANADGTPTPLYHAWKSINREFVAIATQLQPLRSAGVFHAGHLPRGTQALPADNPFAFDRPLPTLDYKPPEPVKGAVVGLFSPINKGKSAKPTHAMVVNLDYRSSAVVGVRGPGRLQLFDAASGRWSPPGQKRLELSLPPGGGKLVRVR